MARFRKHLGLRLGSVPAAISPNVGDEESGDDPNIYIDADITDLTNYNVSARVTASTGSLLVGDGAFFDGFSINFSNAALAFFSDLPHGDPILVRLTIADFVHATGNEKMKPTDGSYVSLNVSGDGPCEITLIPWTGAGGNAKITDLGAGGSQFRITKIEMFAV